LGKGSCTFKEADITRAFKAARKAGFTAQVEIDLERKRMTITPVMPGEVTEGDERAMTPLEKWRAKRRGED
jgi:hypothetical protein